MRIACAHETHVRPPRTEEGCQPEREFRSAEPRARAGYQPFRDARVRPGRGAEAAAAGALAGRESRCDRSLQRACRQARRIRRPPAQLLMPQFSVYRNPNPDTKAAFPLLMDVQSELLHGLATRAVIPMCPAPMMKRKLMRTLTPVLEIGGKGYALLTPQLAG